MRRLILGTAGHIDHGKTALVHALTGVDTDRLPEEKRRGITIDIGFASLELEDGITIGIVDVPGHEAFIRNMLAGATGIDLALLIVAADEGVMPQTREHLAILALLGVRALTVVLTKADLVEDAWLELVRDEVADLLATTPFGDAPIVATSTVDRRGFDTLVHHITESARRVIERDPGDLFRLPIDRVFTVKGTGTVVTGTVWSGEVRRDATLTVLPGGSVVRVRGIQSHGRDRESVSAGERAALAIAGGNRDAIARGETLVSGDGWSASRTVTVRLHALDQTEPIRPRQRVRFHLGTAELLGRIATLEVGSIGPGSTAFAQLRLEAPVLARAGDRFVLRSYSPITTIGGGQVVEPDAPRRRRSRHAILAAFADVLEGDPVRAVNAVTSISDWAGVLIERIPIVTPCRASNADEAVRSASVVRVGNMIFHEEVIARTRTLLLERIDAGHAALPLAPGIARETLRQTLPRRAPGTLADAVLDRLTADGTVVIDGHIVRRRDFQPELTDDQDAAANALERMHLDAGLAPPARDEIGPPLANRADLDDLLHFLHRAGRLVPIAPGRSLHPASLEAAVRLARERFAGRADLSPADFRDLFGVSRKFLIPLLEHLDRTGVTRRNGDARRLEA